ncbi:hypothetical protein PHET_03758, partial [Paragonimus heterotremus]
VFGSDHQSFSICPHPHCSIPDSLAPDFSLVKPHVVISSVDEYLFSWDEPHVQETYSAHTLALTTPQVLEKDTRYAVQIQQEGNSAWETLVENLEESHWSWTQPNPLRSYHVRVVPSNQFGSGMPSRAVRIEPQVVIPDLSFMRPTIESPVDILAGTTAPELVWQLPRAYSLEKTLTPFTYEVQVRGVGHSRSALAPVPDRGRSTSSSRGITAEEEETVWRVLETNVKRTRLTLGRLDPEKEFWLRVVAVTDYGRGAPSQPVRKLVDLAARRHHRMSVSIGTLHEATPISPTFIEPKGQVIYAPIGGHLELKSCLQPMRYDPEIRFSWFLNEKPIHINESNYPHRMSRHHNYVSKNSDYAVLQVDHLTDADFGVYVCKAVNIRGTAAKEFVVKKADAPVFLEVPVPVLTVRVHTGFELPCWVDAVPPASLYWTRDSKRVVESHRTKIGRTLNSQSESKGSTISQMTTNASLSVDRCIYQEAGLYTLVAENIAGRVQTSCLVRIEDVPTPNTVSIRWADIGKHYYVLRCLKKGPVSELRLLIDKKNNQEYVAKLFPLDDPVSRVCGAREFECLSRVCHSNVVQLVDAVVSDNVLILIMERLTGPDVLESMLYCSSWSEGAAKAVIRQVTQAIEHLHSNGVVHFNIQPNNLRFVQHLMPDSWDAQTAYTDLFRTLSPLVSDTMGTGITDRHKMSVLSSSIRLFGFSVAEPVVNDQPTTSWLQSDHPPPQWIQPEFSAPELLLSQSTTTDESHTESEASAIEVGAPADIWSLGVLTYVLLAGWSPFLNRQTEETLEDQILNADYSFEFTEFDNVSEDAKQFIRDLLQKDPNLRPTASECLSHPWLRQHSEEEKSTEYRLEHLGKYQMIYAKKTSDASVIHDGEKRLITDRLDPDQLPTTCDLLNAQVHNPRVRQRAQQLAVGPMHTEDSMSDLSSRASSIPNFPESWDTSHEPDFEPIDPQRPLSSSAESSRATIVSVDDASAEVNAKLTLLRQNTLTEAGQLESEIDVMGNESAERVISTSETASGSQIPTDSTLDRSKQPQIPAAAPTFASPLRDAYFDVHLGQARFSCQLSSLALLPPGIHGHREAIDAIYANHLMSGRTGTPSSTTVAAWYLNGCLLSDGPGVQLGTGPGGWLWLCLGELGAEHVGGVVECVVRNRSGKAKTRARLLQADPPKCPGRPGIVEVHPTEALITWAATEPAAGGDIIYRVDAKFSIDKQSAAWHTLGFTVDCRFLAVDLQPSTRYRMRVLAGNCHGWGNYSIASSEFQTPSASTLGTTHSLSEYDRKWMLTWRQSTDIYALSEHPAAIQFNMTQKGTIPPPVSDRCLQKLQQHDGLIPDLEVLREVCTPEYLVSRGKFSKLIVATTNPMLTDQAQSEHDQLILPPRLLLKITDVSAAGNKRIEQAARQEAIILTGLNGSCGGACAAIDDYFIGLESSCLFTSARHMLPSGYSLAWIANDAAKPSFGLSVSQWIPGGQLLDVVCARTEFSEYSIMRWTQQLLMALRWFYSKLFGRPHGLIEPRHILVARRSSTLPDIVLAGLDRESDELDDDFKAPELLRGETVSTWSDMWSVGAFVYLLMTGTCPDVQLTTGVEVYSRMTEPCDKSTTEELHVPMDYGKPWINFKKIKSFTKPAKKFVYNCLQYNPRKRGYVDFWLESRWFDIHSEHIQQLTQTLIPASHLNQYRNKRIAQLGQMYLSTDPDQLRIP